jgi:hypothetical protein
MISGFKPAAINQMNNKSAIHSNICEMKTDKFVANGTEYAKLLKECITTNKPFRDKKFPATALSLVGFGSNGGENDTDLDMIKAKKWMTTRELQKSNKNEDAKPYPFCTNGMRSEEITQGCIGDCYFLAGLSSVCKIPELIQRIFVKREFSKYGIYCIALFLNGTWESVVVDSRFPVTIADNEEECNEWAMASNKDNEGIWVMLLEKAWAKAHGGYMNIEAGLNGESLNAVTGAPTRHYQLWNPDIDDEEEDEEEDEEGGEEEDEEGGEEEGPKCGKTQDLSCVKESIEAWNLIYNASKEGLIMCASTRDLSGDGKDDQDEDTGIVSGHAYCLMGAYELYKENGKYRALADYERKRGKKIQLVKLRNPWGEGEWKGKWSDDDDKRWTPELKKHFKHTISDDGIFYMEFRDFMKYYGDYQICEYQAGYKTSSFRYETQKNQL